MRRGGEKCEKMANQKKLALYRNCEFLGSYGACKLSELLEIGILAGIKAGNRAKCNGIGQFRKIQ